MSAPVIGKVVLFKPKPSIGYAAFSLADIMVRGIRVSVRRGQMWLSCPTRSDAVGNRWPVIELSRPLRAELALRTEYLWHELDRTAFRTAWTDHDNAPAEFAVDEGSPA
jgi:hypothetical protein